MGCIKEPHLFKHFFEFRHFNYCMSSHVNGTEEGDVTGWLGSHNNMGLILIKCRGLLNYGFVKSFNYQPYGKKYFIGYNKNQH